MKFIADPTLPPRKLKVKLQGEAKKYQGRKIGVYTLQPELVNTYPTWKQISLKNSIWFDSSTGRWSIGSTSALGSIKAGIIGPYTDDDWPQNLSGWKYGDYDKNCFLDAKSDVLIKDSSKSKLINQKSNLMIFSKHESVSFSIYDLHHQINPDSFRKISYPPKERT